MYEDKPIQIKSYKRVWKFERILYKLDDRIKLPRPVTIKQFVYFVLAIIFVAIIDSNTPLLSWMAEIVRYLLLPGGIAFYLSKAKHDGKSPHQWLWTQIVYWISPKHLNRYKAVDPLGKKKYSGTCTFRELYTIDQSE